MAIDFTSTSTSEMRFAHIDRVKFYPAPPMMAQEEAAETWRDLQEVHGRQHSTYQPPKASGKQLSLITRGIK